MRAGFNRKHVIFIISATCFNAVLKQGPFFFCWFLLFCCDLLLARNLSGAEVGLLHDMLFCTFNCNTRPCFVFVRSLHVCHFVSGQLDMMGNDWMFLQCCCLRCIQLRSPFVDMHAACHLLVGWFSFFSLEFITNSPLNQVEMPASLRCSAKNTGLPNGLLKTNPFLRAPCDHGDTMRTIQLVWAAVARSSAAI